jgi:hypothetical protein
MHFFSNDEKYARGIDWYRGQFGEARAGSVTGEVAPQYMYSSQAPARIRRWIDAPDLVFLLRHPLDRAFSNYLMTVRLGQERLSFHEALLEEEGRLRAGDTSARDLYGYMARGRYCSQILRYREHFPASRILLVLFDDLIDAGDAGRATLARIAHFIGLDTVPEGGMKRDNPASRPRSRRLRDFIYGQSRLKKLARMAVPSRDARERLMAFMDRMNQVPINRTMGSVPERAVDETVREIDALERTFSLDLGRWRRRTADIAGGLTTISADGE